MTRHYEAVVVGGRLCATIVAALLAKRGLRTLLVDQGELASQDADLPWDLVPSPAGSPVMEQVYEQLGLRLDGDPRLEPVKPGLQVVFPDQRYELAPDRTRLLAELARERAGQLHGTGAALDRIRAGSDEVGRVLAEAKELPARGYFGRRAAQQSARRHAEIGRSVGEAKLFEGAPGELIETLVGLLPFITHLDTPSASSLTMARLVRPAQRWLQGLGRLDMKGGLRGLFLESAARRAFDEHRGAIAEVQPAGKLVKLSLAQGKEAITTDLMIDASADLSGIGTISTKGQKKELALMLQAAKPKGQLHVVGFELDRAVIPPGMGPYVLLLNGRRDPRRFETDTERLDDRPILLAQRPVDDPARVELIACHPVTSVRAHAQGLDELEAAIRARVQRLIPFLSDGRPQIHVLCGRGATRDRRPVLPHPLFDPEQDPNLGLCGVSMRTPHKNIFVAGPAVLPGLGVEGEYWTALQAVEAATALKTGQRRKKRLLDP